MSGGLLLQPFIEKEKEKEILRQKNLSYEQLLDLASDYKVTINSTEKLLDMKVEELRAMQLAIAKASVLDGVDMQKTAHGKKGADARKSKYLPLKEMAAKLVNARNFKSRRNAAQTIKPEIVAESKRLNIPLSENQAESTITDWLKNMGLPANI